MIRKNEAHDMVISSITEALLQLMRQKPLVEISISELCNKAGVSSRAALHRHLVRMKFEGLIDYIPQKSRTIRILREAN